MSSYPNSIDTAATLYSPVDAFSTRPLETTAAQQILAGDTTISVASTDGFAASCGILSINDELIVYASKTAMQFTGCQRGAFGTTAAQHAQGAAVKANMVSAFITALQSAVTAIENELGTVAARNYVRRDGAVTITGVKTFVDGSEFGSGMKAATGLVRLPNAGAIKWRKADNSGDLGMALNANDHLAFDAVIDFAPGQTFGSFSYPDATTTSKGIVQVDPVGGISVNAGVISLADSGATPGTYPKVTVDAKGRVTAGAPLAGSDLPAHQHVASDIVSGAFGVSRGGTGLTTIAANKLLYSPSQNTLAELAIGSGLLLSAGMLSLSSHGHAQSDVTGLVTDLAAKANKAGETFTGTLRVGGDQAFFECGPYQTVGGDVENMLKRSEDFSTVWSTDGGSCSVAANTSDTSAPDGNQTADKLTSNGDAAKIQQQVAGLADGGTYTFYIWAKVATGTRKVSLAIVDNAYAAYLAGPTPVTLTAAWQRFKITATLASGQTGLWVVVRNYTGSGDEWTNGTVIYLWGACLQEGDDPKRTYIRTWDSQAPRSRAGAALGTAIISAATSTEAPLTIYGPGSNLADKTLLQLTSGGELIIAGGAGNGYRLAELMSASNPSGWSGVLKVKTPAGTTLGYVLLYSNP
jgi:hypothetical protein